MKFHNRLYLSTFVGVLTLLALIDFVGINTDRYFWIDSAHMASSFIGFNFVRLAFH